MKRFFSVVIILVFVFIVGCSNPVSEKAFYEVANLKKTNYKEVLGSPHQDLVVPAEFSEALLDFSYKSAADLLEMRNSVYSPLSLYIALSLLVELTATDTQREVLDLLGIEDIEVLRDGNGKLYQKLSYKNQISTVQIANSIWLKEGLNFKEGPLEVLCDKYYASSYRVNFLIKDDTDLMNRWVKDNTGGLLGDGLFDEIDPLTVIVLLNTLYFHDEWVDKFEEKNNFRSTFSNLDNVEYMTITKPGAVYLNDEYQASYLEFKNGLKIAFAMPLDENNFASFINNPQKLKESLTINYEGFSKVEYQIPKFSFKSSFELIDYIKSLGVELIFNSRKSDFSAI